MIKDVYGFAPSITGERVELAFKFESKKDVNHYVDKIRNHGYDIIKEPWDAPWNQYYSIVSDPDGNLISLYFETK